MKKLLFPLLVVAIVTPLAGCYCTPIKPPVGQVYADFTAPLDPDWDRTAVGAKKGTAAVESVLGLVSWGDCSSEAAAASGRISTIDHADYHYFNVLGVYQKFETIVYGR